MTSINPILSDEEIRDVFLTHGFTIKPGETDLRPYVYEAARALLSKQPSGAFCKELDEVIIERDEYHEIADRLANAVADRLLVEIGEHSSGNCPWMRALEAIENAAPHPTSEHFPPTSEQSQVAPNHCSEYFSPAHIERLISAYGYANRHPEDADGIARAYRVLVRVHEEIRDQALEEAARIVSGAIGDGSAPASKIRSLKSTPAEGGAQGYQQSTSDHSDADIDYQSMYEQMCERCDSLDAKLAEYERQQRAGEADERAAFERRFPSAKGTACEGGYTYQRDHDRWEAWQARAALSAVNQSATTELSGNSGQLTLRQQYEDACITANANERDAARWRKIVANRVILTGMQRTTGLMPPLPGNRASYEQYVDALPDAAMQQQSKACADCHEPDEHCSCNRGGRV